MADFLLYILKINLLAAAVILLTAMVSGNLARKYSVRWKYRIWLALAILLLLPMHVPESWNVVEIHVPAVFSIKTQQTNLPQETVMAESADSGGAGTQQEVLRSPDTVETSQAAVQQRSPESEHRKYRDGFCIRPVDFDGTCSKACSGNMGGGSAVPGSEKSIGDAFCRKSTSPLEYAELEPLAGTGISKDL